MPIPRFFVYGLLDPDTYDIKYIGQSSQGLRRLNRSLEKSSLKASLPKNEWIRTLISSGKIPLFKILEVCESRELDQRERFWIDRCDPSFLLNVAKGGSGGNTGRACKKWKPVLAKNMENGEIIKYDYVWQVEKDGFSPSKVSSVCLGKRKSHKGHFFKHLDKNFPDDLRFNRSINNSKKSVVCKNNKDGKEYRFESIIEASKSFGISAATISNSLRGKSSCRNYHFKYASHMNEHYEPVNDPIGVIL